MRFRVSQSTFRHHRLRPQLEWSSGAEGRGGFGSLFFHILPHVEEEPLYRSHDTSRIAWAKLIARIAERPPTHPPHQRRAHA